MPELARRIASRLRQFVGERRRARRAVVELPVTVSLVDFHGGTNGFRGQTSLKGHTFDMSASGVGLIVSAIRIGEYYLTGEDRKLWLKIELPDNPVELQVAPVRYESLDEHAGERGFLLGVRIVSITEADQANYIQPIANVLKGKAS